MGLKEARGFETPAGGPLRSRWLPWGAVAVGVLLLLALLILPHLSLKSRPHSPAAASAVEVPVTVSGRHPNTEAGAVEAATEYLTNLSGPLLLQPEQFRAWESAVASDGYRQQFVNDGERSMADLEASYGLRAAQQHGLAVALRAQPLAFKVLSQPFNAWATQIAIWWLEVIAIDNVVPPQALWQTTTISLIWERSAWRISNSQASPGPAPGADSTQLPEQLKDYQLFRHVV